MTAIAEAGIISCHPVHHPSHLPVVIQKNIIIIIIILIIRDLTYSHFIDRFIRAVVQVNDNAA